MLKQCYNVKGSPYIKFFHGTYTVSFWPYLCCVSYWPLSGFIQALVRGRVFILTFSVASFFCLLCEGFHSHFLTHGFHSGMTFLVGFHSELLCAGFIQALDEAYFFITFCVETFFTSSVKTSILTSSLVAFILHDLSCRLSFWTSLCRFHSGLWMKLIFS